MKPNPINACIKKQHFFIQNKTTIQESIFSNPQVLKSFEIFQKSIFQKKEEVSNDQRFMLIYMAFFIFCILFLYYVFFIYLFQLSFVAHNPAARYPPARSAPEARAILVLRMLACAHPAT